MSLLSRAAQGADRLLHAEHLFQRERPISGAIQTPLMTPGATPGTLFADPDAEPTHVAWLRFCPDGVQRGDLTPQDTVDALTPQPDKLTWIDVRGTGDRDRIQAIGDLLGIHQLALADLVNVPQRPKTDAYDSQTLCIAHMIHLSEHGAHAEQIGVLLGPNWVLTVQETNEDGDVLEPVRARIVHGKGIGALRRTVHAILAEHPDVERWRLGGQGEGSWGATIVRLRG